MVGPAMVDFAGALIAGSAGVRLTHERMALEQQLVAELQEKLRQYQEAMQRLAKQKAELHASLARQRADQKDVFEYLKAELLKKSDEVRALERRVVELDEKNHRQLRQHKAHSSAAAQAAADKQKELNQMIREQKMALDKVHCCAWDKPVAAVCTRRCCTTSHVPLLCKPSWVFAILPGAALPRTSGEHRRGGVGAEGAICTGDAPAPLSYQRSRTQARTGVPLFYALET
jgi:hypothetical protein